MTTLLMLLLAMTPTLARPDAVMRSTTIGIPLEMTSGVPLLRVELTDGSSAWFVVDTGATGTTVAADVAARVGLRRVGVTNVTTVDGGVPVSTVEIPALRLPGLGVSHRVVAAVHDLAAVRRTVPRADGILGQDVLARYDYLLDFERRELVVGAFEPPRDGIDLPLSWSEGRPVVSVGGARGSHPLVLDSGADVLVMEAGASRDAFGRMGGRRERAGLETHVGSRPVEVESHAAVQLTEVRLSDVRLVRLPREAWSMAPEVGLLPATYFSRVYVSARTGRAMVWEK